MISCHYYRDIAPFNNCYLFACKFYSFARRDFVGIEHMLCTAQHAMNKDKHLEGNRRTASVYASLCLPSRSFFTAIKRCRLLDVLSTKEQNVFHRIWKRDHKVDRLYFRNARVPSRKLSLAKWYSLGPRLSNNGCQSCKIHWTNHAGAQQKRFR